jgi:hypothetical protein
MPEPVIHIEHLSHSFGMVKALDDLSLGGRSSVSNAHA